MTHYTELLDAIDPASLAYDEWLAVGMAIQHEGGTATEWDAWSRRDTRAGKYHAGECERKWSGFRGNGSPVTWGTLYALATRHGWHPKEDPGRAFEWDDTIENPQEEEPLRVIDPNWVEDIDVETPGEGWDGIGELITYLSTVFESSDYVGYVCESWKKDGSDKFLPKKGSYSRTAGELIADLSRYRDIGMAFGDYDPEAGAWIRFNPLDGQGVKDSNVTSYRYALVESDDMTIERQAAIYAEMELPIAALVHSGSRSLHAIVRVDAPTNDEYRLRVNYLHDVCKQNGLNIDTANRNPSRLSRMPGVTRNGNPQFLVAVNQGKASWEEWKTWVEEINDDLPDFEPLADVFYDLPELAPPLIDGVLRVGHKMLLAGPSKAGKSYLLLQLVIAIAEGKEWLGWPCQQGKILYINLELDRASCLHRLVHLYKATETQPDNLGNIDLWNLRGSAVPMDKLAPKLIRRALKSNYTAIIIDPIYKVITGDENAADKMAHFCNQFDKLCTQLGSAVIYCHHHSKGAQGAKASRDRSSGSGVFARDPDALLDLIELVVDKDMRSVLVDRAVCNHLGAILDAESPDWRSVVGQDDAVVATKLAAEARRLLGRSKGLDERIEAIQAIATRQTGWRMEGTLREFAPFQPKDFWFRHPTHVLDADGTLVEAKAEGEEPPWKKSKGEKKEAAVDRKQARMDALAAAFSVLEGAEDCTVKAIAEYLALTEKTARTHVAEHPGFRVVNGIIEKVIEA